jgi:pyridoxine 5'-phosphate synthase PdxJ
MSKYVGYYEGYWRANLRKVTMSLKDGALHATGLLIPEAVTLIPESDTVFTSEEGVSYKFVMDASGAVTHVEEIHRGGNYILNRKK